MPKIFSNSSEVNNNTRVFTAIVCAISFLFPTSCAKSGQSTDYNPQSLCLTVSNPAMAYFVSRLAPASVSVNVMIPQGADHDTYTPKPSQMAALASSQAYVAFGPLEFELTWKDRILSSSPNMKWCDVSEGVNLIESGHACSAHRHSDSESHAADPHYWLSPRQANIMAANVASVLKSLDPEMTAHVDSALSALDADIAAADSALASAASANPDATFVIYHPALAYVARDYGFHQLVIGGQGVAPSPKRYAELADSARRVGAKVFFLQAGFAPDRVESSASEMGARIVRFQPESADWSRTMATITEALR